MYICIGQHIHRASHVCKRERNREQERTCVSVMRGLRNGSVWSTLLMLADLALNGNTQQVVLNKNSHTSIYISLQTCGAPAGLWSTTRGQKEQRIEVFAKMSFMMSVFCLMSPLMLF